MAITAVCSVTWMPWQAVRETRYIGPKRPNRRAHCPGCTLPVERRIRFSPINTVMRKELEGLGADVTWFQGPGAHSWQFWDQEIKKGSAWMLNAEKQEVDDETQRV